jgi:hypothetical protein
MRFLITISSYPTFSGLGIFIVNSLLWLDGHVYDIGCFGLKSAFCMQ